MGETTGISWTDATWNGWTGCTKVSPACDNCYAERDAKRYGLAKWGKGEQRVRTSVAYWKKPLTWDRKCAKEGTRMKVFAFSMADVFDEEVPDEWRDEFFELVRKTPNLDWLVLTKRAHKMYGYAERFRRDGNPLPKNVWWGVTVEDQTRANQRIPYLLSMPEAVDNPAAVLWVSAEPLRGPVDFTKIEIRDAEVTINALSGHVKGPDDMIPRLDWIITGGESGPNAKPADPTWYRDIRTDCSVHGTAFFFKQWGEWMPLYKGGPDVTKDTKGVTYQYGGSVYKLGRKHDPQTLDGIEYHQFPERRETTV